MMTKQDYRGSPRLKILLDQARQKLDQRDKTGKNSLAASKTAHFSGQEAEKHPLSGPRRISSTKAGCSSGAAHGDGAIPLILGA
jgi:hypothetical protein